MQIDITKDPFTDDERAVLEVLMDNLSDGADALGVLHMLAAKIAIVGGFDLETVIAGQRRQIQLALPPSN